ncbi:MAG TPA: hypothetical protein VIH75_06040 [Candidatus Sulfotelmatobacter sp.]
MTNPKILTEPGSELLDCLAPDWQLRLHDGAVIASPLFNSTKEDAQEVYETYRAAGGTMTFGEDWGCRFGNPKSAPAEQSVFHGPLSLSDPDYSLIYRGANNYFLLIPAQ